LEELQEHTLPEVQRSDLKDVRWSIETDAGEILEKCDCWKCDGFVWILQDQISATCQSSAFWGWLRWVSQLGLGLATSPFDGPFGSIE